MVVPRTDTVLCDTDEALNLHYRIRYKVFCEEAGFEDTDAFQDGREKDRFDEDAAHFLIFDRLRRCWMGATRLVDGKRSRLPLENICNCKIKGLEQWRSRSIEFSRLAFVRSRCDPDTAVLYESRRPVLVGTSRVGSVSCSQNRGEALVRVIWATIQWAKANDVERVYGIVAAPLARMLKRLGVPAAAVGVAVNHRGMRTPYLYDVREAEQGIVAALPQYDYLFDGNSAFTPFSEFVSGQPAGENGISAVRSDSKVDLRAVA